MTRPRRILWWALAAALAASAPRPGTGPPPGWLIEAARRAAPRSEPARMGVRDLRRIPGVGEGRARAVVDARRAWSDGLVPAPEAPGWSDVRGIGPATEEAVRRWLLVRGLDPDSPLLPDERRRAPVPGSPERAAGP